MRVADTRRPGGGGGAEKNRAKRISQKRPDIVITTTHSYKISYKFNWKCNQTTCGKTCGPFPPPSLPSPLSFTPHALTLGNNNKQRQVRPPLELDRLEPPRMSVWGSACCG